MPDKEKIRKNRVTNTQAGAETFPFTDVEEAWFWFIQAQQAKNEGARIAAGQSVTPRPCEPSDILLILAPSVQPYVPKVSYSSPAPTSAVETPQPKTEGQVAAESRTESLLRRSRGQLGTVLTGFKGFLDTVQTTARKTLLGE